MFVRQFLPTWAGGIENTDAKATNLLPGQNANSGLKPSAGMIALGNSKSLSQITSSLDAAQRAMESWVTNFQNLQNQIKLPNDMSPVAKYSVESTADIVVEKGINKSDDKAADKTVVIVSKTSAVNNESHMHLPNTRIQTILKRVLDSVEPDHNALQALANQGPSLFKPTEKDREIKMGQLAIKIARKLRDMVDDVQLVVTECLLDEEIGAKLARLVPGLLASAPLVAAVISEPVIQQAKELGDQLLRKHIQKSIDEMQDRLNKISLDFMKIDRSMHKRVQEVNRKQDAITPDKPEMDGEIRLTLPSASSSPL